MNNIYVNISNIKLKITELTDYYNDINNLLGIKKIKNTENTRVEKIIQKQTKFSKILNNFKITCSKSEAWNVGIPNSCTATRKFLTFSKY